MNLVVLDFDGTITNVDEEARPYVEGYKNDVKDLVGLSQADFDRAWESAAQEIRSNPSRYGWENAGRIIAPAYGDPILFSQTVVPLLFDQVGILKDEQERTATIEQLYEQNYPKTKTVFREGADEFLTALLQNTAACVVTNARTQKVEAKLAQLPTRHALPVYGHARKNVLDLSWTDVPESIDAGLGRPVFLQRKMYADVLAGIMEEKQCTSKEVTVFGDIFEMDLALPQALGMNIALAVGSNTLQCEREAVRRVGGVCIYSLEEASRYLCNR